MPLTEQPAVCPLALPCLSDPTSGVGLRPLEAQHPNDWHFRVQAETPGPWTFDSETTVAGVLTTSAVAALMPRTAEDRARTASWRGAGRLVKELFGATPAREVDDRFVAAARRKLANMDHPRTGRPVGSGMISRSLTVLRTLASTHARLARQPCRVTRSPHGSGKRAGSRRLRATPDIPVLRRVLEAADPVLAVALALATTTMLGTSQLLRLRWGDLDFSKLSIRVEGGGVRGRRDVPMATWVLPPKWVWQLLLERYEEVGDGRERAPLDWVFTGRVAGRPRVTGFDALLRRACGTAGCRSYTLGDFRRLGQSVAREAGASRSVVRGTVTEEDPRRARSWHSSAMAERKVLARHWSELAAGPLGRVPRHPPKVRYFEPELAPDRPAATTWAVPGAVLERIAVGPALVPAVPEGGGTVPRRPGQLSLPPPDQQPAASADGRAQRQSPGRGRYPAEAQPPCRSPDKRAEGDDDGEPIASLDELLARARNMGRLEVAALWSIRELIGAGPVIRGQIAELLQHVGDLDVGEDSTG